MDILLCEMYESTLLGHLEGQSLPGHIAGYSLSTVEREDQLWLEVSSIGHVIVECGIVTALSRMIFSSLPPLSPCHEQATRC